MRLKSRNSQIPNGLKYRIPELKWEAPPMSFDVIVRAVISVRQANPAITQQHGWPTDYESVANEVDEYNAKICADHGWDKYLALPAGGHAPPKPKPLSQQAQSAIAVAAARATRIWQGVKTLNQWLESSDPGVAPALAASRASTCASCPKNEPGGLEAFFTGPASEVIRSQIEKAASRKLSTPFDDDLRVCSVCACPLRLAVHVPLDIKLAHLSVQVEAELRQVKPPCWVITEKDAIAA